VVLVNDRPYQYYSEYELQQILESIEPLLQKKIKEKQEMPNNWSDYPSIVAYINSMSETNQQISLEFAARREERRMQTEARSMSTQAIAQPTTTTAAATPAPDPATSITLPPGWYSDSEKPKRLVRWDGQNWAEELWISG
jgi:hypothetical protein